MNLLDRIRAYWDADAPTYDRSATHAVKTKAERAAWTALLLRWLPDPPAHVLDVGAGTGFLAIQLARLGFEVTALDLSPAMLERLSAKAAAEDLDITILERSADRPPEGPFDAVVERHVLWFLPDPQAALRTWRKAAPSGRLLLVEGLWGQADPASDRRRQLRGLLDRLRRKPPAHHADFSEVGAQLPLGRGAHPNRVVRLVEDAGWAMTALERARDVEWARLLAQPPRDRLLGTTPQYVVAAQASAT